MTSGGALTDHLICSTSHLASPTAPLQRWPTGQDSTLNEQIPDLVADSSDMEELQAQEVEMKVSS